MIQPVTADLAQVRIPPSLAARRRCRGAALPKAALALVLSAFLTGCTGIPFDAAEITTAGGGGAHNAIAVPPRACTPVIPDAAVDETLTPTRTACRPVGTALAGGAMVQRRVVPPRVSVAPNGTSGTGRLMLVPATVKRNVEQLVASHVVGSRSAVNRTGAAVARVATFNVLGASHTRPGGNSTNHIPGRTRMRWTVTKLSDRGIDIVGMQEFEPVQEATFTRLTRGTWNHFPISGSHNVVAWRSDRWVEVERHRLPVPYFHGHRVGMPYVLLQDTAGHRVWVISVHNPADTRGRAGRWRKAAVRAEAHLVARLHAEGTPVLLTGDMNERTAFFCQVVTMAPVHAANGGNPRGSCQPPTLMEIDWIVGTPEVAFSGYTSTRHAPINRASDHRLVYADIALR